jgi:sugar phosphate isomerase/epimerase
MTGLRFGFGTNGFTNHRLADAVTVLADLGYDGIALTLDHCHLDPFADDLAPALAALGARLDQLRMSVIVETGARYLLDPRHKHAPTLLAADGRDLRIDYLSRAVRIAAYLGAQAMSFWSGTPDADLPADVAWDRLVDGCHQVVELADRYSVPLGFEPEPGMLVDTIAGYEELARRLGNPACFGVTLDIGHCRCVEEQSIPDCIRRVAPRLVNVQIDDMRRGTHEHLEFGAGEIDFPPVLAALREVGYQNLVAVELPRHGHAAPDVAARSLEFLRAANEGETDDRQAAGRGGRGDQRGWSRLAGRDHHAHHRATIPYQDRVPGRRSALRA